MSSEISGRVQAGQYGCNGRRVSLHVQEDHPYVCFICNRGMSSGCGSYINKALYCSIACINQAMPNRLEQDGTVSTADTSSSYAQAVRQPDRNKYWSRNPGRAEDDIALALALSESKEDAEFPSTVADAAPRKLIKGESGLSSFDGGIDVQSRIFTLIGNGVDGPPLSYQWSLFFAGLPWKYSQKQSGWVVVKILGLDALVQKAGKENDGVESLPFFRKTIHDLLVCFLDCEDKGWVRRYLEYTDESHLDSENRLHFIQGYHKCPKNDKKRKGQETAKIVQHPRPTFREMLDRNSQRLS